MKGMAGGLVEGLVAVNVAGVDAGCLVVVVVVAVVVGVVLVVVAVTGNARGAVLGTHGGGRRTDCSLWGSIERFEEESSSFLLVWMFSLSIPGVSP